MENIWIDLKTSLAPPMMLPILSKTRMGPNGGLIRCTLTDALDELFFQIIELEKQNKDLQKRIDLLENNRFIGK